MDAIKVDIIAHVDAIKKSSLRRNTVALLQRLEQEKPEYHAWLSHYGIGISIDNSVASTGVYHKNLDRIFLNREFLETPQQEQAFFLLKESIIRVIGKQTKFTSQKNFIDAVSADVERLEAKTALALSRLWHQTIKRMPTGEIFRKVNATDAEMLPEILLCRDMLEKMHEGTNKQQRVVQNYKHLKDRLQLENDFINPQEAYDTLMAFLKTKIFGLDDVPDAQLQATVYQMEALQPKQIRRVDKIKTAILVNEGGLSVQEIFEEVFPKLSKQAKIFDRKVKNIVAFFSSSPKWEEALYDTQQMKALLKKGTSPDVLEFLLEQELIPDVRRLCADVLVAKRSALAELSERYKKTRGV